MNYKNNKALLRRYLDDLYTKDEARQLLDVLQQPASNALLDELATDVWSESASQKPVTDLECELYKSEARQLLKRIEHKKRTWLRRIAIAALSAAALCGLVWGGSSYLNYVDEQQITYLEASTSYGESKQLRLPDGTLLVLNSCSQVRYPSRFTGKERRVELEGEGYFRVHSNAKYPFLVSTRRFDVRVLGTSFDVKAYSSDEVVSVDVESGKVQVDLPEAMMRLQAKEQVFINTLSGEYSKRREERIVAAWRKGGLRFHSTPVRDVAKELERMHNCRITFAQGQEFKNLISGEHDNMSLESVLQSIEYTSGIRYKKEGNRVWLYKE